MFFYIVLYFSRFYFKGSTHPGVMSNALLSCSKSKSLSFRRTIPTRVYLSLNLILCALMVRVFLFCLFCFQFLNVGLVSQSFDLRVGLYEATLCAPGQYHLEGKF